MTQTATEARVPLPQPDDADPDLRAIFQHVMETRGLDFLPNVFRSIGNSPGALEAVASVGEHIRFHTAFDDQLRELLILTVAQESRCAYEWTHHVHIAKALGVDEATIATIGSAEAESRPAPAGAALRYARLVANNEPVDDSTVSTLREALGDGGLVDLTVLAGFYSMLARVINTLQAPLEMEAAPFARA
jgi:4-carboxymuconolactone decarboxylase